MLESAGDSDVEAIKKMMTLYRSCMDTDTIDERGADPLISLINETGELNFVASLVPKLSSACE